MIMRNSCDGRWAEKCWGWTRRRDPAAAPPMLLPAVRQWSPHCSVHELLVVAGGFCSIHWHYKINRFWCETATIVVRTYDRSNLDRPVLEELVRPGEMLDSPTGVLHQFAVMESGKLWELYWPGPIGTRCLERDICRLRLGGYLRPSDPSVRWPRATTRDDRRLGDGRPNSARPIAQK